MFDRIKALFRRNEPSVIQDTDLEIIASDLDQALWTYAELLDNSCRDAMIMDAARERIEDLREQYQKAKLDQMQDWTI